MMENRKTALFYSLLVTQTISLIGSSMTALALGIWIFQETGEATPLVLVSFFNFLPRLLSASIAGVLADRWDRRYVMAIADAGQAVGTLVLLASFASGSFEVWHLYVVQVIQSTFGIFQMPAFQASVTMLISDKNRSRANALQLITGPFAGVIAPALTGAVYGFLGVSGIIALDLTTFLLSMLVLLIIKIPRPPVTPKGQRGSIWREAMAGFQFVWERKPMLMIFVFTGCTNFFLAGMNTLNTPYILSRTDSEATLGSLLSVFSLGSLTGTLFMAITGGFKRRVWTMMPAAVVAGVMWAVYGTLETPIFMAIPLFIAAMFPPINNVSIISTLQIKVPPELQGRVFAAISQISMTLIPLSYLVVGPLADRVFEPMVGKAGWQTFESIWGGGEGSGIGLMLTIGGLAISLISAVIFSLPIVRNLETLLPDYVPQAVEDAAVSTEAAHPA